MRYFLQYSSSMFRSRGRLLTIVFIAILFVIVATLLPNRTFVGAIIGSDNISFVEKIRIVVLSLGAFRTAFTVYNQIIMVVIGVLFGMQFVLTFWSVRQRFQLGRSAGMSTIAFITGMFGVGCSACGSILLTSFFGVGVATFAIHRLPLHGYEFGLASILILMLSLWYTEKQVRRQKVCVIQK